MDNPSLGFFSCLYWFWCKASNLCSWFHNSGNSVSVLNWTFSEKMWNSFPCKTESEFAFRTLKKLQMWQRTMKVQSASISKCHSSQSEQPFLSEVRNCVKNVLLLYLRMAHLHLSSEWIPHRNERRWPPAFQRVEAVFIVCIKKHPDLYAFHVGVSIWQNFINLHYHHNNTIIFYGCGLSPNTFSSKFQYLMISLVMHIMGQLSVCTTVLKDKLQNMEQKGKKMN